MAHQPEMEHISTSPSAWPLLPLCLAVCLGLPLTGSDANACTTFKAGTGHRLIVAKSYDWRHDDGLALVNKRGLSKQALLMGPGLRPARWTARYGSVTFNQHGRDFPLGGMNEKGLVMEIMWLRSTRYPTLRPKHPTVNELQLIQYVLDTTERTQDAVEAVRGLQVAQVYAKVHYMVCDRVGTCATLEFIDGKLRVHSGSSLVAPVLTNSPYAALSPQLKGYRGFGGAKTVPKSLSSRDRFIRTASRIKAFPRTGNTTAIGFAMLDSVRTPNWSRWQIVYQPNAGLVSFRRAGHKESPIVIKAGQQDYSCKGKVTAIDVTGRISGKRGKRFHHQSKHSLALIRIAAGKLRLRLPDAMLQAVARHPEASRCQ